MIPAGTLNIPKLAANGSARSGEAERLLRLPYHIVLVRDGEGDNEDGWTARVQELPGCEAHEPTSEEAAHAISSAMRRLGTEGTEYQSRGAPPRTAVGCSCACRKSFTPRWRAGPRARRSASTSTSRACWPGPLAGPTAESTKTPRTGRPAGRLERLHLGVPATSRLPSWRTSSSGRCGDRGCGTARQRLAERLIANGKRRNHGQDAVLRLNARVTFEPPRAAVRSLVVSGRAGRACQPRRRRFGVRRRDRSRTRFIAGPRRGPRKRAGTRSGPKRGAVGITGGNTGTGSGPDLRGARAIVGHIRLRYRDFGAERNGTRSSDHLRPIRGCAVGCGSAE